MKDFVQLILISAVGLAVISCGSNDAAPTTKRSSTLQVDAYRVLPQPFNNELKTTADLMAQEQVELVATMPGQVLDIYFKEGQQVSKGQKIIRLDDRSWKAQIIGLNAELHAAEKDLERKEQLLSVEGSSQEEIDIAHSKIESLKAQIQELEVNIDLANVKAPFAGQLGMRDFSEGAFLQQGALITTLSANDQLKVGFTIPEAHAKSIQIGKTVIVKIEKDTLLAKIYAVSPVVNVQTRTLQVRARLDKIPNKKIYPGAFAEVLITTDVMDDALLIPTQSVVPSINEQTVYVYKSGKAIKKVVTIGNRTADKVHVLTGIAPGDTVLTTGLLSVKSGMPLNLLTVN